MARIHVAATADALSLDAAEVFSRITGDAVQSHGRCTVALAGGSTPRGLYRALAHTATVHTDVPWTRLEFFWGDERHVPPDHADSNYRMAYEAMLSAVPVTPQQIHRIRAEQPDAAAAAREYEEEILTTVESNAQVPCFDLILLGLGKDGHIASLFPGTKALTESGRSCVENWVPALGVYRITMTLPVLNHARAVVFLVSGADKSAIVRQVLRPGSGRRDLPAQLVEPQGDVVWMLDRDAASGLGDPVV